MKKNMLKEALLLLEGPFKHLILNLRSKDGEKWFKELKRFLRQEPCWTEIREMGQKLVLTTEFLYLYPSLNKMDIGELKGNRVLDGLNETFPYGQRHYDSFGLVSCRKETKNTEVLTYRLRGKANVFQLFYSFGCKLDDLCFTQDQIAEVIQKYPGLIEEDGWGSGLFLFKKDEKLPAEKDNLFVTRVTYHSNGRNPGLTAIALEFKNSSTSEDLFGRAKDMVFIPCPTKKNRLLRFLE